MNDMMLGRMVTKLLVHLPSYRSLKASIDAENCMCSYYGIAFTLPVERLHEACIHEAVTKVAKTLKLPVRHVRNAFDAYSHSYRS